MKQPDQSNVNRSHEQRQHQQLQQAFPFLMINGRTGRPNSNALLCVNLSDAAQDHFNRYDEKRRLTPQELRSTLEEALRLIEEDFGEPASSSPFGSTARVTTTYCHSVSPLERRHTSCMEEGSSTSSRSRLSLRYGNNQDETEEDDTDTTDPDDTDDDNDVSDTSDLAHP